MQERPKTRERDAEVTREAILDAAEQQFAEKGFDGARVDAIAAASGYNKALIFHYFDGKEELYRTLITRHLEQNVIAMTRIFGQLTHDDEPLDVQRVHDALAETIRWTFTFYQTHPRSMRMMGWEAASGWTTFSFCAAKKTYPHWPHVVRDFLRRAQAQGIVRADLNPEILVLSILSLTLIHQLSLPRYQRIFPETDFTSPAALEQACEQLVRLMQYGTLTSVAPTQQENPSHASSV